MVRKARFEDLAGLAACEKAHPRFGRSPIDFYADLGCTAFVSLWSGVVTGAVWCREYKGELEIVSLAVRPDHRRRGHGRELLQRAHAWGREQGLTRATLKVNAYNRGARRLYESFGYRVVGGGGALRLRASL
jgi:ribosomal protein S18 acetylase RimI-like enzyme